MSLHGVGVCRQPTQQNLILRLLGTLQLQVPALGQGPQEPWVRGTQRGCSTSPHPPWEREASPQ